MDTTSDTTPESALRALLIDDDAPDWSAALCAQTDPEVFFPEKGGSTREAKRICAGCPIRPACLRYALETGDRFGVWGGLSERERRRLATAKGDSKPPTAAGQKAEARRRVVAQLVHSGATNAQIASKVGVSQRLVERDRQVLREQDAA
jgi:WhiB family redox-sensing transcriptional regulator